MEIGFIVNQITSLIGLILLPVWIYLVFVTLKKKSNIFHDQMKPELAERRLRRLKAFLLVAGISLAAFIANLVLYFAIGDPSGEEDEPAVVFFIAVFSYVLFNIGAIGGLVIFLKGREKPLQYDQQRPT